jgi:hypothetical protein
MSGLYPADRSRLRSCEVRRWRVSKVPSSKAKHGKEGDGEQRARYFCSAARGHVEV